MRNIIIVISIGLVFLSALFLISACLGTREENDNENVDKDLIIRLAIFPTGTTHESYLIEIDGRNLIRTQLGIRNEIMVSHFNNEFFSEVLNKEERTLDEGELYVLSSLFKNLEITNGIMELDIADGSWEVVLQYNGIIYAMDYWVSDFEPLRRLVDEIIRLSPIPIELHSWS